MSQLSEQTASFRLFASLNTAIRERDCEIDQLNCRLAEARDQQASIHGVATAYPLQLMEAIVALCTGGAHALRVARRTIEEQRRIIAGQWNMLRRHHIPWPLYPSLEITAGAGMDAPD